MFPSSNPAQSAKDLKAMIGFDVLHKDKLGEAVMCTHPDWSKFMGRSGGGGSGEARDQISPQGEMEGEDEGLFQASGWKARGQGRHTERSKPRT